MHPWGRQQQEVPEIAVLGADGRSALDQHPDPHLVMRVSIQISHETYIPLVGVEPSGLSKGMRTTCGGGLVSTPISCSSNVQQLDTNNLIYPFPVVLTCHDLIRCRPSAPRTATLPVVDDPMDASHP